MSTVQILRSTILKQSTEQSSRLVAKFKAQINPGRYAVTRIEAVDRSHIRVSFDKEIVAEDGVTDYKTWIAWGDDVQPEGALAVSLEASRIPEEPDEVDWNKPNSKVSKFFTVKEVTQNDRHRIPQMNSTEAENILRIARELDRIREDWGCSIGVTSWYRPYDINIAVGGVPNSQHIFGSAADIYTMDGRDREFERFLSDGWGGGLGFGIASNRGFTHLDLRDGAWKRGTGRIRWNY